jgi:hypothetical protein
MKMNTCENCKFWDVDKPVIKVKDDDNKINGCCTNTLTRRQIKNHDIRTSKDFGCINFE